MSETITFKPETLAQVHQIIGRYPQDKKKSALIPILHLAQKDFDGWLAVPVMDYVAEILDIKPIEVYEVATFYTMFNMKPVGKYVLEVCQTGPCMLNGSHDIINHIKKTLNIKNGETSALKSAFCCTPRKYQRPDCHSAAPRHLKAAVFPPRHKQEPAALLP